MKPIQSRLPWAVHPKRVVNKLGRDTANEATQIQAVYELQAFTQTFEAMVAAAAVDDVDLLRVAAAV